MVFSSIICIVLSVAAPLFISAVIVAVFFCLSQFLLCLPQFFVVIINVAFPPLFVGLLESLPILLHLLVVFVLRVSVSWRSYNEDAHYKEQPYHTNTHC